MMKNKTILTKLFIVLSFLAVNISFAQKPHNPRIFEKEIIAFEKSDEEQRHKPGGIVFTGSSSIRRWNSLAEDFPHRNVLNRGFGGSRIGDATFYFERIISKYNPVQVVLYSGENDIAAGKTPEMVFDKFKKFYYKMKEELPNSELVFLSMKPSLALWEMYPDIQKSNKLIENFIHQNNKVKFVDISSAMLGKDGKPIPELFVGDGLHMTPKGYLLWKKILEPYLKD